MLFKRSLFRPQDSTIMSMKSGPLYPALVKEMYPNERIVISHEALLRAAPMLFPLYSPVKLRFDYYFSPNRIVWRGDETDDWSTFITGAVDGKVIEDPDDIPEHPWLTVPSGGFAEGSLADYLGFNTESSLAGAKVSAMRFRHYQKICKDFYLDENFSTMPSISYASGEDTTTSLDLQYRCWNKDRFTTASLEPQKGLSIGIAIAGSIPVVGTGDSMGLTDGTNEYGLANGYISTTSYGGLGVASTASGVVNGTNIGAATMRADNSGSVVFGLSKDPDKSGVVADTSQIDPIPIDELHFLTQVQRLNQRDNMWGSRDFECIRTHFGCEIEDTRLQRATHLGWSEVDVNFSEVLQTSQTTSGDGGSAQGNITGHTFAVDASHPVKFFCREWGFLFVIVNVQPIAQYQQGIPRDALYQTRYDYMWPILSETGEQELYEAELYATAANIASRKIFGFEPRYNHLRFGEKTVHGAFRSSLASYHTGRIFNSEPNLGESFIKADPTNRMFAVEFGEVDPWWLRVEFNIKHVRRLPKWPNPSSIGKLF